MIVKNFSYNNCTLFTELMSQNKDTMNGNQGPHLYFNDLTVLLHYIFKISVKCFISEVLFFKMAIQMYFKIK